MKITSKALAGACLALLVLYPLSAVLWFVLSSGDNYGIMAALLAVNAGVAFTAHLGFDLPEFSGHAPRQSRHITLFIAAISGCASGIFWMTDEVENIWHYMIIMAPVLVVLLLLAQFVDKVNKERAKQK